MFAYAWFILIFPLLGFIALSWFGNRLSEKWVGMAASATVGSSFLLTLVCAIKLMQLEPAERLNHVERLYTWVSSGAFNLDLAILVDPLSVFMFLVVTGVGSLIHVYSISYMKGDPEFSRFFAYLNLFVN